MEPVNILLVDDHPAKLLSYETILQDLGERLIKAQSAVEALEQLLRNDIAVVLVDVCMPETDGFELAAMIRDHPRFRDTAIIFVSAVLMTEPDRLRGYAAGAVDYVSVPIVPELLRAKVRVFADLFRKTRELERLNADLERRVLERTAQLEASSAELRQLNEDLEHRIEQRTKEREEALAQLFESQKLDTIGHLTGGVAHDFNNLLMAVLGSLSLLKKRLSCEERNERLIDNAIHAAERGAALTKRLLAFARRQDLDPHAVNLARLVADMSDLLAKATGPGIEISRNIPDYLPAIMVDPNQLELVFLNLVVNARDAMPDGGVIEIAAKEASREECSSIQRLGSGAYVEISVRDNGYGMDSWTVARATEPFFTTKGPGKGTGLGLSMAHGLAAQSGGVLEISSAPGEGALVRLWLPVSQEAPTASQTVKASRTHNSALFRPLKVLLVDDDPLVSLGTAAMLEELGHASFEAGSAAQALEALGTQGRFDLLITDHAMAGMTGIELSGVVAQRYPNLPIILASGYAELPDGANLRAVTRLAKPFDEKQLRMAIDKATETQSKTRW
jgi:signal transduction histidine kinase